jgi:streptomycin 6-kinase
VGPDLSKREVAAGIRVIVDSVRAWGVEVERTTETDRSILVFGQRDGRPVVLKIIKPLSDESASGAILEAFDGRGTIRVYERTDGSMLLERAVPGHSLVGTVLNGSDDEATRILASVIARMSPRPLSSVAATVQEWGRGFDRYLASSDARIPNDLVLEARRLYFHLCESQTRVRLLHGDLHHDNVVFDRDRGWLAIDPKGVVGELEYEIGTALRNPWESPELFTAPATIEARVQCFSRELSLNADRVLSWAFSQAVLSAIWTIEDGLDASARTGPLALAQTIRPKWPHDFRLPTSG